MLDYLGIFREFNEKKIGYLVVGGTAVNLHGIPRMTYDIDLILDMDNENIRKFLEIVKGWGFYPKVPVDIMDFAERKKREEWIKNKNMKAFNLTNPEWAISEIDIIIDSPVDYQEALNRAKYITIEKVNVPVIGMSDLIKMKKDTGRLQDKADIENLKRILKEK